MSDIQALIDELWDFDDPSASEIRFLEAIRSAHEPGHALELQTQVARAAGLSQAFANGHSILDATEQALANLENDSRFAASRVRCLLERGRLFNSARDRARALPLFHHAMYSAHEIGNDHLAIDAAHMIAIVHGSEQRHDLALEWNRRALETAEASTQPRARQWRGSLHNNIGWTLHDQGDYHAALAHFETALQCRIEQAKPGNIHAARWCVARCLRSLKQFSKAIHIQCQLERERKAANLEIDGFVAEEIAESLLATRRQDEAKPYFAQALASLSQISWIASEQPQRLERLRLLSR